MLNKAAVTGRVLIVDDNPQLIRLLSTILHDICEVSFATSGEEALRVAARQQPQVILLDMQMPGMDGFETCRALKNAPETSSAAVLFVTAHTESDLELRALELGAVDFIAKPFNPAIVTARVKTHLLLAAQSYALRQLVERDALTGLYNRRYFDAQLREEFDRHRRHGLSMAITLVDVDHFKLYNDGYGHVAGDDCLRQIATVLQASLRRPGEFVARYGGEEFCIVHPYTDHEHVQQIGDYLCEQVRKANIPHAYSPTQSYLTVSIGIVSCVPKSDVRVADIIAAADEALYLAKRGGRNTCRAGCHEQA